ncbi:uncharacterized protein LAESUDRAFT_731408 [Laetiporus sulphureus 93-53]|uniref:PH domain-containing protein n=1 Tax=Laetiporus sulphureus 93-53 TaxID=1314785 RepID=A0A165BJX8_9APHY|nr:uncharacterized protein LAESUDRAFT_731408 [Laetiporus sulphureus 93-53]KZT01198.1 hypothetical protein LAESUDRAFT_731408 [Laetiporus sulphureus 93-53]
MSTLSDGDDSVDAPTLFYASTNNTAGLRLRLQNLIDSKEQQIQQAGELGQQLVTQRVELEERMRQLDQEDYWDSGSDDDDDAEGGVRGRNLDLEDTLSAWDVENERLATGFGLRDLPPVNGVHQPYHELSRDVDHSDGMSERSTAVSGMSAMQASRRARNATHRSDDVEFAYEIGTGLLSEVRRLQSLVSERDATIRVLTQERDMSEDLAQTLREQWEKATVQIEKYKDANWDMEVKRQELQAQLQDSQNAREKLDGENRRLIKALTTSREAADHHKGEAERHLKAYQDLKAKHETDVAQARKNAASLQRDKSDLQQAVDALKVEMAKSSRRIFPRFSPSASGNDGGSEHPASGSQEEDDALGNLGRANSHIRRISESAASYPAEAFEDFPEASPDLSPTKPFRAPNHPSNEIEALQQRLAHAQRQVNTLKSTLQREKELRMDFKRKLDAANAKIAEEQEEENADEEAEEPSKPKRHLTPFRVGRGRGRGRGRGGMTLMQRLGMASHSPSAGNREEERPEMSPPPPVPRLPPVFPLSDESQRLDVRSDDEDEADPNVPASPTRSHHSTRTSLEGMDPAFANVLHRNNSTSSLVHNASPLRHPVARTRGRGGAFRRPRGSSIYQRPPSFVSKPEALAAELGLDATCEDSSDEEKDMVNTACQTDDIPAEVPLPAPAPPLMSETGIQVVPEPTPVVATSGISMQTEIEAVPLHTEMGVQHEDLLPEPVRTEAAVQHESMEPVRMLVSSSMNTETEVPPELLPIPVTPVLVEAETQTVLVQLAEMDIQTVPEAIPMPVEKLDMDIQTLPLLQPITSDMQTQTLSLPTPVMAEMQIQTLPLPASVTAEMQIQTLPPVVAEMQVQTLSPPAPVMVEMQIQTLPPPVPVMEEIQIQTLPLPAPIMADVQTQTVPSEEVTVVAIPSQTLALPVANAEVQVEEFDTPRLHSVAVASAGEEYSGDFSGDITIHGRPVPLVVRVGEPNNDYDLRTQTPAITETDTDDYQDARQSMSLATPSDSVNDFHSIRTVSDNDFSESEDDNESIVASRLPSRQGLSAVSSTFSVNVAPRATSTPIPLAPTYESIGVETEAIDEFTPQPLPEEPSLPEPGPVFEPKPEFKEMSIQTDEWIPPAPVVPVVSPVSAPVTAPPTPSLGPLPSLYRVGANSQHFQFIPPPSPAGPSTSFVPAIVAPSPSPSSTIRDPNATLLARPRTSHSDRRQSMESSLSYVVDELGVRTRPQATAVDKSRPPTIALPPPPRAPPPSNSMPPPSTIPDRRILQDIPPPRPSSPPPAELIQRATSPIIGSVLSLPGGRPLSIRLHGSTPSSQVRELPSTGSFRSAANTLDRAPMSSAASAIASSVRERARRELSSASINSARHSLGSQRSSISSDTHALPRQTQRPGDLAMVPGRSGDMLSRAATNGSTEPIIHAITQTMIGEFFYKYTRRTLGRGPGSSRHRRYVWIHPYTRTLYWSTGDPSSATVNEATSKSTFIESVRSVLDPNPMPPGLYQYSLIITTPHRELKFTASTKERHELWLSALSYLIARSNPAPPVASSSSDPPPAPLSPMSMDQELPDDESQPHLLVQASPNSQRSTRTNRTDASVDSYNTPRGPRSHSQMSFRGSMGRLSGTPAAEYLRWAEQEDLQSSTREHDPTSGQDDEELDFELHNDTHSDGGFEGLENVRACCDGRHTVGRAGMPSHTHHHHHHHQEQETRADSSRARDQHLHPAILDSARPASPSWSFRSRTSSSVAQDGSGFLSRFGTKRSTRHLAGISSSSAHD